MNPEDKRRLVADLNAEMKGAKVAILTRFTGLNVEKMTQLRRELRKGDVKFRIIKNTLFDLAIRGTDKEILSPRLEGPIGVAWSAADPVAPARILAKFAKDFPEFAIMVAASEGKVWELAAIQNWVNLPSLDELRARIVGLIQAPASKIARLTATPGTRIAQVLQAHGQQS